ncbi:MAG: dTDP-4-dehydrorhamnose reductase, partial [Marinilabiliaceae bacterium]
LYQLTRNDSRNEYAFSSEETLDLTSPPAIDRFFAGRHYDVIINCAAYTAVDKAESDRETAFQLNAKAPGQLAEIAQRAGARMVHISTDYVFGNNQCRPLKPDDPKTPVSVYGKSKLQGEENIVKACPDSVIIRTSWLYSLRGNNFLKTMMRLGKERDALNVVFDQVGTPTLASDLGRAILTIAGDSKNFKPGIYHYSNEGVCSWYDFAVAIFNETGIPCKVSPVESDLFPTPAPRPAYSVMDKSLIKETYGISIPHWQESLKKCLHDVQPAD